MDGKGGMIEQKSVLPSALHKTHQVATLRRRSHHQDGLLFFFTEPKEFVRCTGAVLALFQKPEDGSVCFHHIHTQSRTKQSLSHTTFPNGTGQFFQLIVHLDVGVIDVCHSQICVHVLCTGRFLSATTTKKNRPRWMMRKTFGWRLRNRLHALRFLPTTSSHS